MIPQDQASHLLKLARQAIESEFSEGEIHIPIELQDILTEKRGVFVTLHKKKQLRGCIGFSEPIYPLGIALIKAAKLAAFDDPRFPSLQERELKQVEIEITVLTPPKKIQPKPENIEIGKDGLIVKKQHHSGLLLPQVAVEQGWDAKTFLEQTCVKAGLPADAWKLAEVYKFQGEIIKEQ